MATKRETTPEAPPPDPLAPVGVKMLTSVNHENRPFLEGQPYELPRDLAVKWFCMGWAECAGVTFSRAELWTAGAWALAYQEQVRGQRGAAPNAFWRIPINARWLARLDSLTNPDGPKEAA